MLQSFKFLNLIKIRDFDKDEARKWMPIAASLVAMIYTGSKALQFLRIPIYTIFKNLTIILIAYGEVLWFGGKVTRLMLVSFGLMVSVLCVCVCVLVMYLYKFIRSFLLLLLVGQILMTLYLKLPNLIQLLLATFGWLQTVLLLQHLYFICAKESSSPISRISTLFIITIFFQFLF